MIMDFIFNGSIVTIFFFLLTFIFSLVFLKGLIQKKPKGLGSQLLRCQLLLVTTCMICTCRIIEFFSFMATSTGAAKREALFNHFGETQAFLMISATVISVLAGISLLRFREKPCLPWYSYANFIAIPVTVQTLLIGVANLVLAPAV